MKITGLNGSGSTVVTPGTTPRAGATTRSEPPATADEVRLSSVAAQFGSADAADSVSVERVQAIRQAIAEGRFQINAGAIADRLLTSARELVDAQRRA